MPQKPRACPKCKSENYLEDYREGVSRCATCTSLFTKRMEARFIFLELWGRAKDHDPEYEKDRWIHLQNLLNF